VVPPIPAVGDGEPGELVDGPREKVDEPEGDDEPEGEVGDVLVPPTVVVG
jgi:hypothetical protein